MPLIGLSMASRFVGGRGVGQVYAVLPRSARPQAPRGGCSVL